MKMPAAMTARRTFALALLVAVTIAGYIVWKWNRDTVVQVPAQIEDYVFWQAKELSDFQLIRSQNRTLGLADLRGKWTFVFFGYTHCPDICPATLAVLGQAFRIIEQMPGRAAQIQGVFISVDPKRDAPDALADYASYFNDKFLGVTGSIAQLDAFSRQIGVMYAIQDQEAGKPDEGYLVTHSSTIFLIDPQGRLFGRFPPPQNPQEMAEVFMQIRAFHDERGNK